MGENGKFANPFADFNANYMSDESILKYWVKPELLFELEAVGIDLVGKIPVVVQGGRGTGKTMLLRYLSYELQLKDYEKTKGSCQGFIKKSKYLGVYYRFDGPKLSSFSNKNVSNVVWDAVFKNFVELVIGQKYLTMLCDLHRNKVLRLSKDAESSLCHDLSEFLFEKARPHDLSETKETMTKLQRDIERFTERCTFGKTDFYPSEVVPPGNMIFGIPKIISKHLGELQDKNIILLLDEYENLTLDQQTILNTYIKHTQLPVTFRLGMRINGFRTHATLNENEFLREGADFRRILFENIMLSKSDKYRELLKRIAQRRLELHPELRESGLTDIAAILGNSPSPEQEAKQLLLETKTEKPHFRRARRFLKSTGLYKDMQIDDVIEKLSYPDNPLVEMLNILLLVRGVAPEDIEKMMRDFVEKKKSSSEYKKYEYLYGKNKVALVFHLAHDCRRPKRYYGFDAFCMLSSGIIRSFVELCYHTFNYAIFSELDHLVKKERISWESQNKGAEREAKDFFDWMQSIPKHGSEVTLFVDSLGTLFRSLHYMDERISEPEPTYFNTEYGVLSKEAKEILDVALMWSTLQEKEPMQPREPDETLPDVYAINKILAPRYRISYRTRGRTDIKPKDLELLILGSEDEKKNVVKRYSREPYQSRLFDAVPEGE